MSDVPASWRAAVLRRAGSDLEVIEVLRPELRPGQVLVRLAFSGVCRSQLMEVRGLRGVDPWVPHLLGHEGVGTVAQVAEDVTKVKPGDRVVVGWIAGVGLDSSPPVITSVDGERINAGRVTTFSEWTVVAENRVYRAPAGIDDRTAVLFGCALLTGAGMVIHDARVKSGDRVLISGAGGVGLAAVLAATGTGAQVIVVEPDLAKRERSMALGAVRAFDPKDSQAVAEFRNAYPDGVDVAIDASGSVKAMEFAFSSVRFDGGTLVFASHPPVGEVMRVDPHDLIRGRQLRGSWGGGSMPDEDIAAVAQTMQARGLDLGFMTPDTYRLDDVNEALVDLEQGRAMRPLLDLASAGT